MTIEHAAALMEEAEELASLRAAPWRRLLAYLAPYRRELGIAIGAMLVSGATGLAFPWLVGDMLGLVFQARSQELLNQLVLGLVGLFAIQALSEFVHSYYLGLVGERVVVTMRAELYRHLTTLSLDFFVKNRTGELLSRLRGDVSAVGGLLTSNLTLLIGESLTLIAALVIVFALDRGLALFTVALAGLIVVVGIAIGGKLERVSARVQDALARATVVAEEGLSGMRVVQSFSREPDEARRFKAALEQTLTRTMGMLRLRAVLDSWMVFLGLSAIAAVIWFGGQQVLAGTLPLARLTSFLIYGVQIAYGIGQLASIYGDSRAALGAVRRVFGLLDQEPTVRERQGAVVLTGVRGELRFDNVSFGYQAAKPILRNVNLVIAPGEVVAIAGRNGAGKSSLINLVPRLFDPTAGAITLDGHDLRDLSLPSLRQQIGLVAQETLLFGGSVRENIRYGRLDASDAEIIAAARAAQAHGFIERLPEGYDTLVGERGGRLSGGERRRIAIARALLKDPRILLLDEATSDLDNEAERLIQATLRELMAGRTTLIVAHRLSTLRAADRVVVLDGGRIIEEGTHDSLLAAGKLYAGLYALQLRAEVDSASGE